MKKINCLFLLLFITTDSFAQNASGRKQAKNPPSYLEGYTGAIGCPRPMILQEFEEFKSSVSMGLSDESKTVTATQSIFSYCLLCSQIIEIMNLFGFEESKLHYAKLAYRHAYDIDNYPSLIEVFEFQKSVDELNEYINAQHKKE